MIRPVDYKQNDSRWGGLPYAVDGEKSTIKSAGCGPTSLADVLAAIVSPYICPVTLASWARQHNYKVKASGTSYNFFVPCAAAYGVTVRRLNTSNVYGKPTHSVHTQALNELQKGNWLIACMGKGNWTSSGHYVVAYGIENGYVYINDPASTKGTRACNTWELFKSQVKYYWVVEVPESIKKNGIVKDGEYLQKDFIREVQMCIGAGIRYILNEISGRSGIFNVHPHRFRRTFATSMINRGMDIQEVKELLGHSNIETTMEYIYIEDGKVHESYRRYSR